MNVYQLSRAWFNFSFANPTKVKPNHTAVYFFAIEHCNRLGWKRNFGLPTTMVMEAVGIRSYNTYKKTFDELEEFGFLNVIERSKNQYSSNIVALSFSDKALDKALDNALMKHGSKQSESTEQSIDSIIKQIYNKQINNNTRLVVDELILAYQDLKEFELQNPTDEDPEFISSKMPTFEFCNLLKSFFEKKLQYQWTGTDDKASCDLWFLMLKKHNESNSLGEKFTPIDAAMIVESIYEKQDEFNQRRFSPKTLYYNFGTMARGSKAKASSDVTDESIDELVDKMFENG